MTPESEPQDYLPEWLKRVVEQDQTVQELAETVEDPEETVEVPVMEPEETVDVTPPKPVVEEPVIEETKEAVQKQTGGDTAEIPVIASPPRERLDETVPEVEPLGRSAAEKRALILIASATCFAMFMLIRGTTPWIWGPLGLLFAYKAVKQLLEIGSIQERVNKDG